MATKTEQARAPFELADAPAGITLIHDSVEIRIVIRPVVSRFWKTLFKISPWIALVDLFVVSALLGAHLRHDRLLDPLLLAEIPALMLLLAAAIGALCWLLTKTIYQRIIWSTGGFRLENVPRWLRIPASDIVGFNAYQSTDKRSIQADFSGRSFSPFRRAPSTSMEIIVPDGRIRVLDGMTIELTRWLADALNSLAGVDAPASPPSGETVVAYAASPRFFKPIAIAVLLAGMSMPALILKDISPGLRSRHWPDVSGHVVSSSFIVRHSGGSPTFDARMTYTYSVANRNYRGDRISFAFSAADDSEVRSIVDAHPPGSSIPVYYNPAQPGQAVVLPGVSGIMMLLGGVSVFVALLCASLIYPVMRSKTPTPQQIALAKRYAFRPPLAK